MLHIIVPTYNRVETCREFLTQLSIQTFQEYRLILVDHGKEKTNISDNDKIKVIQSDVNGWARAVNIGLRFVLANCTDEKDLILIINDDVLLDSNYLEQIIRAHSDYPNAIIGSCCIDKNSKKTLRVTIQLNKIRAFHVYGYQSIDENSLPAGYLDSDVLTGKGTVFPISILKDVGIYNEQKLPHYKADHELVWRCKRKGYKVVTCTNMRVYTLSDQKKANGKEPFFKSMRFFFFDMRSTSRLRDWWNYAFLAYSKPYALYFFFLNFIRNTTGIIIEYLRTR